MTIECAKFPMKEDCICEPSSDECTVRKQSYCRGIDDFRLAYYRYIEIQYGMLADDEMCDMNRVAEKLKAGGNS